MPRTIPTPDRLFDRTWRPGHPFRPRVSVTRRVIAGFIFFLLCLVIGGYWYITDSDRVRVMAQAYLSRLIGGPVRVADAKLSIFEGLRLDGVRIYVDEMDATDSLLFSAQSFLVQYDPRALLTGRIEGTRIVAVEPRVHVAEDADTGQRNYERLIRRRSGPSSTAPSVGSEIVLPEIVLRNAQVDYRRVWRGRQLETSSIAIEGRLVPVPASQIYSFTFQSLGKSAGLGPMVTGRMVMGSGKVSASLQNFEFGADVKTMLPPEVRDWWQKHDLSGRVNIPLLSVDPPGADGDRLRYNVEIELQGVKLSVHPSEWMSADDDRQLEGLKRGLKTLELAGLNGGGFVDRVSELVQPAPISLKDVRGVFVFSDDQKIQIKDLNGRLEEIPFKIDGQIGGYDPRAPVKLRVASSSLSDIEIPPAPRYINSLPPAVREIYDRFKPRGTCRFWVELNREHAGERPHVTGEIEILDGSFSFEKFPYPLRRASGRIVISRDPQSGEGVMRLDHIRGSGVLGGPNADAVVDIDGIITPFGPESRVDIVVQSKGVSSEPALMAAFPSMTRKALALFDAPGKGEFPRFSGDFTCQIIRHRGLVSHWDITTTIDLVDATGSLVAFPYPMSGVNGNLVIYDDYLQMNQIRMTRGQAQLTIDGRVSWPSSDAEKRARQPGPMLKPDLKITARNVPIDRDLLAALHPARRAWLEKLGAGGHFDLDGTIKPATRAEDDLDIDLRIAMKDGTLWPTEGTFAVSQLTGNMRLTNGRLSLGELRAKRGDSDLSARGEISWISDPPSVVIEAKATALALDTPLYQLLPAAAQGAWKQVNPKGSADVSLQYSGMVGAAKEPAGGGGYEVVVTPRKLSATPAAVPYRLDDLAGSVTIRPGKVTLDDLTARHGDARIRFAGTGAPGERAVWDFTLKAEDVRVDSDLRKAVPKALGDLLESMQLAGPVNFEFSRLHVESPRSTPAATRTTDGDVDVDFAARLEARGASLDVGVPLADVQGAIDVTGSSRGGKLHELTGSIDIGSLTLAGRPVNNFQAQLAKAAGSDRMIIDKMGAKLAGGDMVGRVDYAFPEDGPSRYAVALLLRDADVKELAGEGEQDIHGALSASLALEGTYAQPGSRRGRGDVSVTGEQLYKIPLVLGLLQITNLSLPITSPFTDGSARYSIDGNKVSFEQIELRSKGMLMQGDGNLDFGTKQVRLRFSTDSRTWPKVPVIGELIEGAKQELLQIQVRGTLQEPKVTARSMNTLTTTVDEVFKGDSRQADGKQ